MGVFNEVEHMFRGVTYNRFTSKVIREAMTAKVARITAKITERRGRVEKIIADNGITPETLSDLVVQYAQDQKNGRGGKTTYSVSSARPDGKGRGDETLVPAGVVANLVTEKELIASEQAEAKRMELILRNLRDEMPEVDQRTGEVRMVASVHSLSDTELEYLGF